jgi:AcrR family transcriptional regulator
MQKRGTPRAGGPRQRLPRQERYRQLIETAWRVVREAGSDALTLGTLAEQAGVAKPVVYDHFATRNGLLAALYGEFDTQQHALIDAAMQASEATLASRASVIAGSYVDCVLAQGRELPGVRAALAGAPELEAIKRESESAFLEKCRDLLAPFAPGKDITAAGLRAMQGAAEALSDAAAAGDITPAQAKQELRDTIEAMVVRQPKARSPRRPAP